MPLPESGVSQFIHAIIKILGNHLLFCVCDLLQIDIHSLTDLDRHILISLKGPG